MFTSNKIVLCRSCKGKGGDLVYKAISKFPSDFLLRINSRNEKNYLPNSINRVGSLKIVSLNNEDGDILPNEIQVEKRIGTKNNRHELKLYFSRTKRSFKLSTEKAPRLLKADDLVSFNRSILKLYPELEEYNFEEKTDLLNTCFGLNYEILRTWFKNSKSIKCIKIANISSFSDLFYAFPVTKLGPFERQQKVQDLYEELNDANGINILIENEVPTSFIRNRSLKSKVQESFSSGKHPTNDQLILPELLSDMYDEDEENYNSNFQTFDLEKKIKSQYSEYQTRSLNSVFVNPSHIHKYGLFARMRFNKYDIVIEYVGELIRNAVADKREKEYRFQGFGDCYMFRIDQDFVIDATFKGNEARYLNHSCNPNCASIALEIDGSKKIVIYAKQKIEESEELTYDYQFEAEAEKLKCTCGAKNCQGRMN